LRNRLIVATLSGPGYIFAYSPQTQQWSLLSEFNNEDFQSIVYRPGNDTLYAVRNAGGILGPIDSLFKYGPNGQFLGTVPLQYQIPQAQGLGDSNYQLMVTDDPNTMAPAHAAVDRLARPNTPAPRAPVSDQRQHRRDYVQRRFPGARTRDGWADRGRPAPGDTTIAFALKRCVGFSAIR
jgi:hypothetical protein